MKKLLLLILPMAFLIPVQGSGQGQARTQSVQKVSGKVVDTDGDPVAGVTVVVRGTQTGVITDAKGLFTISINKLPNVLSVSLVGYDSQYVTVSSASVPLMVTLEMSSASMIDDVVVIGYGTLRQSGLATSVSSVREKDLQNQTFTSIEQALQGKVAGVSVIEDSGEPGGGISVSVRGINSLAGSGQPLYVIDGIPLNVGSGASGDTHNSRDNPLAFLNPEDVQSIDVMKDAAATAIYGSRGSNGVILITTRQSKAGRTTVNFTSRTTFSHISQPLRLLDAWDYAALQNYSQHLFEPATPLEELAARITYYNGPVGSSKPHPDNILTTMNWPDAVFRDTWSQVYQLTVSGGTAQNSYLASFNYTDNQGAIINSGLNKYSARISLSNMLLPNVTLKTNLNYTYSIRDKAYTSATSALDGVINNVFRKSPLDKLTEETDEQDSEGNYLINPYNEAMNAVDRTWANDMLGSLELTYNINKNLSLVGRTSGNYNAGIRDIYYPLNTRMGDLVGGRASKNTATNANIANEVFLSYDKSFNKHGVNAVVGGAYEFFQRKAFNASYEGIEFMELGMNALEIATRRPSVSSPKETSVLESGFFRIDYNYDKRYILNLVTRVDGSSKFGADNKWGYFPSAAAAWVFSNEKFMSSLGKVISNGKLRFSYGIVGNQSFSNYNSLKTYGINTAPFDGTYYNIAAPSRIPNPKLKWESTESFNAGIDLSFFNNRISVTADAYRNTTRDLLYNRPMPGSSGFTSMWQNIGSIRNTGYEFEVMAYPVNRKDFTYNTRLNLSHNRGVVLTLGGDPQMYSGNLSANLFADPTHILQPGKPLGQFYGFRVDGLIQIDDFVDYMNNDRTAKTITVNGVERPAFVPIMGAANVWAGAWKYVDANNDGALNEDDKCVIGNSQPDLIFGWTNNFTFFKNFEVSIFLQGAIGLQVMNVTRGWVGSGWNTANPTYEYYENMWTLENRHNNVMYPAYGAPGKGPNSILRINDALVEDADYVKLKSVTLRYNLPAKILSKTKLRKVSVFVTGTNLLTITKYTGPDPEVSSAGKSALTPGIDNMPYPRAQAYTFGLNVGF